MEGEQSKSSPSFSWQTLVLVGVLLVGYWLFKPPLISSRPESTASPSIITGKLQDIPARLWQDPFHAILSARQSAPLERKSVSARSVKEIGAQIADYLAHRPGPPAPIKVVMVLTLGGPYPNDVESR